MSSMTSVRRALLGSTLAAGIAAIPAFATVGYFAHGYGTQSKAMAGAGVALPLSALAPATNPAGLALLDPRIDLGLALFSPNREYTVIGAPSGAPGTMGLTPGTVTSDSKHFAVPSAAASMAVGTKARVGLALFGNGGMNTDYAGSTFYAGKAGVDLEQAFLAPTYAQAFGRHALGISPIFAYQTFEARGLASFSPQSSDAACLSNRHHDSSTGFGARVGYLGQLLPMLSIGASYQTRLSMSRFKEYQGLFAEQGSFDIPSTWTAGLAITPREDLAVAADVQRIYYSDVKAVGNHLLPNLMQSPLGTDAGAGFGWNDMTVVKLGAQWQANDAWSFRGGYAYGKQPIDESEVLMNILAPGVMEQHATVGLTRAVGSNQSLSLAVMRAFTHSVAGANPLEAPGQQEIKLQMDQWDVELGWTVGL